MRSSCWLRKIDVRLGLTLPVDLSRGRMFKALGSAAVRPDEEEDASEGLKKDVDADDEEGDIGCARGRVGGRNRGSEREREGGWGAGRGRSERGGVAEGMIDHRGEAAADLFALALAEGRKEALGLGLGVGGTGGAGGTALAVEDALEHHLVVLDEHLRLADDELVLVKEEFPIDLRHLAHLLDLLDNDVAVRVRLGERLGVVVSRLLARRLDGIKNVVQRRL